LEGKFVVGYSGNLGRAHEVDTLIDAIARLEQESRVTLAGREEKRPKRDVIWLFIGGGALYRQLQAEIHARGITSVHFLPYQPRERLAASLSVPDVHLVSLRPELEGLIIPSKYYGIAAAGRPAIFIGDSDGEIARILKTDDIGRTIAPGDGAELAALIWKISANPALARRMGLRARRAFEQRFNLSTAVAAWADALTRVEASSEELHRSLAEVTLEPARRKTQ
jgi:glycosyltransferase involved in cell wall biosynthesis